VFGFFVFALFSGHASICLSCSRPMCRATAVSFWQRLGRVITASGRCWPALVPASISDTATARTDTCCALLSVVGILSAARRATTNCRVSVRSVSPAWFGAGQRAEGAQAQARTDKARQTPLDFREGM